MQTKICQSVGTGIVRYIGETYNFSLNAFGSLTKGRQTEIISSISQSVSTAAKLEGHTTTLYYLTHVSSVSKKRGVRLYMFIQTVFLSPEQSATMDKLLKYVAGEARSKPKKWISGIFTTATKEELQGLQSDIVSNTSSNQKTTQDVPTMTQLSLFDSYQPNSASAMSKMQVGENGIMQTSITECTSQSIIKRLVCRVIGRKNFTRISNAKKLLITAATNLQKTFLKTYLKSMQHLMRRRTIRKDNQKNTHKSKL